MLLWFVHRQSKTSWIEAKKRLTCARSSTYLRICYFQSWSVRYNVIRLPCSILHVFTDEDYDPGDVLWKGVRGTVIDKKKKPKQNIQNNCTFETNANRARHCGESSFYAMLGSKPNSQCDTADWTVVKTSLKPSSALKGQGQEFSRTKLYLSRCLIILLKNRQQSIKCCFLLKVTRYVTWYLT